MNSLKQNNGVSVIPPVVREVNFNLLGKLEKKNNILNRKHGTYPIPKSSPFGVIA